MPIVLVSPGEFSSAGWQDANTADVSFPSTLVFCPGGPDSTGVFASWEDLMAVLGTVNQPPQCITVDDRYVTPAVIPAGNWNLRRAILQGFGSVPGTTERPTTVQLADGCQLSHWQGVSMLRVVGTSSSAVFAPTEDEVLFLMRGAAELENQGSAPMIQPTASGVVFTVSMELACKFLTGGVILDTQAVQGMVFLWPFGSSRVEADTVRTAGTGTITAQIQDAASRVDAQPTQGLGLFVFLNGDAARIGYTPGEAANWAGPAPDDLAEALDRLAAAGPGA